MCKSAAHRATRGANVLASWLINIWGWEVLAVETTKQITVFLENKPGRLANVLSTLAREKVNITALSVMDKHEHSVLRMVTDDAAKTMQLVQALNTPCT